MGKMKKALFRAENVKGFSVDAFARSLYITLSGHPIVRTEKKSDQMYVDYDKDGKIVGIEFIRVKSAQIKLAVQKSIKNINRVVDPFKEVVST